MDRNLLMAMATATILAAIKDPDIQQLFQRAMLKIFKTLAEVYCHDADFIAVAQKAMVKP